MIATNITLLFLIVLMILLEKSNPPPVCKLGGLLS